MYFSGVWAVVLIVLMRFSMENMEEGYLDAEEDGAMLGQDVCNSCGETCASKCGTRKFRNCCYFNFMRKKKARRNIFKFSQSLTNFTHEEQRSV
ncbi:unnamed protein product [Allacma fusca]|uniref:Trissin n=1 Tax=Allacma fusca TaxID=39272 RepID=A0A8J2J4C4_9HEXA|nr:unnamed protein product [Allacma fusca]